MLKPEFSRGQLASILGINTQTIANREKSGKYPEPKRDVNDFRYYTLEDVFAIQLISFNAINPAPILEVMYDIGYRDQKAMTQILDETLNNYIGKK